MEVKKSLMNDSFGRKRKIFGRSNVKLLEIWSISVGTIQDNI